ncbi:MATE family efflux transporter [bacterium]|nr:MATE family efflux transporter [bacterium]
MGGAPKAAIALGKNEKDMAERIMGSCMALLLVISFLLTAGMLIWGKDILLVFGASKDTINYAVAYMRIYCLGTVFIQLSLGLNTFITVHVFPGKHYWNIYQ